MGDSLPMVTSRQRSQGSIKRLMQAVVAQAAEDVIRYCRRMSSSTFSEAVHGLAYLMDRVQESRLPVAMLYDGLGYSADRAVDGLRRRIRDDLGSLERFDSVLLRVEELYPVTKS